MSVIRGHGEEANIPVSVNTIELGMRQAGNHVFILAVNSD